LRVFKGVTIYRKSKKIKIKKGFREKVSEKRPMCEKFLNPL